MAVVPGYYLVCYNYTEHSHFYAFAVVPGYYLVCYNMMVFMMMRKKAVVPGYYLVCYNGNECNQSGIGL